jgi:hypothetical protein
MSASRRISVATHGKCIALQSSRSIFACLGTNLSKRLAMLLDSGDHEGLISTEIDPLSYDDPDEYRRDYLAVELLSKFPALNLKRDRAQVALDKFKLSEISCTSVNRKILSSNLWENFTPQTQAALFAARAKIAEVLGPFSWDEAECHFGFGPGATFSRPRTERDAYYKFGLKPSVTRSCAILAYTAIFRIPIWYHALCRAHGLSQEFVITPEMFVAKCLDVVPGNRVVTVPKNAKTDRIIAIEPCMNIFIQKGIGTMMRNRLRRVGVNLNDQSLNQRLALVGSQDGSLATIDLSAASDSIPIELVELLLPSDWWSAIRQTRSPRGVLPDGTVLTYQKVSSMGNGFTFELESLLFWALSKVVMSSLKCRGQLAVYGDDIVIPTDCASALVEVLKEVGFSTNSKKTFIRGPFRESCGKHYFRGVDVTPFYIREKVDTYLRMIWLANSIKLWSSKTYLWGLDPTLFSAYNEVVLSLPPWVSRHSATPELGDVALWRDFDEARPGFDKSLFALYTRGFIPRVKLRTPADEPLLLRCLYGLESKNVSHDTFDIYGLSVRSISAGGADSPVGIPGATTYKVGKLYMTQWQDLGPWLNTIA